ncbi:MAG: MarR family winged helix-turn-helix transcriptional regulator [Deltaproteobacteria bacterium]|nr:MarR family winged helix-turn-helix transcriptional regulator [Deltaproteobacteria bacterium]
MNDKHNKPNKELLDYQTERIKLLIADMVECCEDRKFYESQKFDLPYAEIKCLMLFNGEHYLTVKDMAQKLDVAKSRVTKLVKNLMNKGLLQQIDDPMDARVRLISLTSKGSALAREIETFQTDIHQQLLLKMEPTERKNALVYMETLRSAMEEVKEKLV